MTGLLRKTMLLACTGVLAASSAMAAVPSASTSVVPCGLNLVGTTGGVADPKGQFTINVNDLAGNGVPGSSVVIDFTACDQAGAGVVEDIQLCSVQPVGGVSAVCTSPVGEINAVTDGAGDLTLRIVGGATNAGSATAAGLQCATVYADGVNLGTINVGAFDQDGGGGVDVADLSLWLDDSFETATQEGRSDYDCSGEVDVPDLSIFLDVSASPSGSDNSCTSYCN